MRNGLSLQRARRAHARSPPCSAPSNRATAAGEFVNNSVIIALDEEGRTIARLDGLRDSQLLLAALTRSPD